MYRAGQTVKIKTSNRIVMLSKKLGEDRWQCIDWVEGCEPCYSEKAFDLTLASQVEEAEREAGRVCLCGQINATLTANYGDNGRTEQGLIDEDDDIHTSMVKVLKCYIDRLTAEKEAK